jgi:hypothetical protein
MIRFDFTASRVNSKESPFRFADLRVENGDD